MYKEAEKMITVFDEEPDLTETHKEIDELKEENKSMKEKIAELQHETRILLKVMRKLGK